MDAPPRLTPLCRRTRLAVVVGLLGPGLLLDALDAFASSSYDEVVTIGHRYRFDPKFSVKCPGCDESIDPEKLTGVTVYLDVKFKPEGTDSDLTLLLRGDAIFVPPATGRLHDATFNLEETKKSLDREAERQGCPGARIIPGSIHIEPVKND